MHLTKNAHPTMVGGGGGSRTREHWFKGKTNQRSQPRDTSLCPLSDTSLILFWITSWANQAQGRTHALLPAVMWLAESRLHGLERSSSSV